MMMVLPPELAYSFASDAVVTGWLCTLNVADEDPDWTVTLVGTEAPNVVHCNVTTVPPVGAGAVSVTVPLLIEPPVTDAGLRV